MTRYARADGSKAANKREEEAATPWSVMVRGIRSGPPPDRRSVAKSRPDNPEDFDEADDIALANQNDSDDEVKNDEQDYEEEVEEQQPCMFVRVLCSYFNLVEMCCINAKCV